MNSDLISVIMPAYNAEKFIAESIESVINQTNTRWELLIVDDGSIDNTSNIIKDYQRKDSRIKYYYQPNGKQGKARNHALTYATGKYIAFIDADDVWLPLKLQIQLQQIKDKRVDLVFSDASIFTTKFSGLKRIMQSGIGIFKGEEGLRVFLEKNQVPILTVLAKKELITYAKGFTEKPAIQNAEDYHLWLRLLMNGATFYGSDMILAAYREHEGASTKEDKLSVDKVIEVFKDLKQEYKSYKKLLNAYHKQWFKRYHYLTNNWDKKSYKRLIAKNCSYLNRHLFNLFFQSFYAIFGLRLTRKVITRFLNAPLV